MGASDRSGRNAQPFAANWPLQSTTWQLLLHHYSRLTIADVQGLYAPQLSAETSLKTKAAYHAESGTLQADLPEKPD